MRRAAVGGLLLAIPWGAACRNASPPESAAPSPTPRAAFALPVAEAPQWVQAYDPARCASGYNLILFRRRIPALIDMNGAIVHAWPCVRASARARLLPNGHLALITDDGRFEEYDWDGARVLAVAASEGTFFHHDFAPRANGSYLLIGRVRASGDEYVVEIDRSGRQVWRWDAAKHLAADVRGSTSPADPVHLNSLQELPPNRWFDGGRGEFKPGNLLLSARNLSTLYVIERASGDVVWRRHAGLDAQHEARMSAPGQPSAGHILLFNNGCWSRNRYRRSTIEELDPVRGEVVWQYSSPRFFSSINGVQQLLGNGNVLVTSSQGGRVFEIARDKRIVWQWVPPYLPLRVSRYPYGYCPQLAERPTPAERPVARRDPEAFVDYDLYRFALHFEVRGLGQGSNRTRVLRHPNSCRTLVVPERARLDVAFGVDRKAAGTRGHGEARFRAWIRPEGARKGRSLVDRTFDVRTLAQAGGPGRVATAEETHSLSDFEGQTVELCFALEDPSGEAAPAAFVWGEPIVRTEAVALLDTRVDDDDDAARAREEEQLRALGYVN